MRTLKQAADELNISKDRVKYWVKKQGITPVKVGKITHLTDEQFLDLQAFILGKTSEETPGNYPGKNPLIEVLQKQLETKDQQIHELQKALERAQSLQLVAESKLQLIEDKQKKPGFLSRLFK